MIARYLKYGNHCLLYQTVVLEDNIIITINREKGGWCDKTPRVSTKVYDTRLEAKTAFKQLCNELAQEYTKI